MLELCFSHSPFFLNCSSAVSLIFLTRYLMHDCLFPHVGCLAVLHMVSTAAVAWTSAPSQLATSFLLSEKLLVACITNVSLISMNLSLMLNSVGTYQISKILMIPTCALIEYFVDKKTVSQYGAVAMTLVMLGVGIATVSDIRANIAGVFAAFSGVLSSSGLNVACSHFSRKYNISASEFVVHTMPMQLCGMFVFGPLFDVFVRGGAPWSWVGNADSTCLYAIFTSCCFAAAVNLSLVACVKRYDASRFQILSHTKTVLVLMIGWIDLEGRNVLRQIAGSCIAVTGMVMYSKSKSSIAAEGQEAKASEPKSADKGGTAHPS